MVRNLIFISSLLFLFSCAGGDPNDAPKGDPGIMRFFEKFPRSQFMDLQLGSPIEEAKGYLAENGFELTEEESLRYKHEQEEIEVIIPDGQNIYSMKVFIYNPTDIKEADKLDRLFLDNASENSSNPEFSYYLFHGNNNEYSLTMFTQPDFIRLEYELKSSH